MYSKLHIHGIVVDRRQHGTVWHRQEQEQLQHNYGLQSLQHKTRLKKMKLLFGKEKNEVHIGARP